MVGRFLARFRCDSFSGRNAGNDARALTAWWTRAKSLRPTNSWGASFASWGLPRFVVEGRAAGPMLSAMPSPRLPPDRVPSAAEPGIALSPSAPSRIGARFGLLLVKFLAVALWLCWTYAVTHILVTSVMVHRGQPENYFAAAAFFPSALFTLMNLYWIRRKSSTLPLPALTAWVAAAITHGLTTIGPVVGLACFLIDPLNPLMFVLCRVVLPQLRRQPSRGR